MLSPGVVVDFLVVVTRGSGASVVICHVRHTQTLLLIRKLNALSFVSLLFRFHGNSNLQRPFSMVKVSFNKALALKDPKKESLIPDVQVRY